MQTLIPDRCLVYYITDRTAFGPDESSRRRCLLEKVNQAARAGVDYIQLREKDLSTRELEFLAHEAVDLINQVRTENQELRTALLINSRTDVALAAGADGVHLRSDDISPLEVNAVWRRHVETAAIACPATQSATASAMPTREHPLRPPRIGVSCRSAEAVFQAEADGATFAVFAPVFEKRNAPGMQPAGLAQLREACRAKIPILALGGVTVQNAKQCLEAGAAGIAAIRLFQENDAAKIVQALRQLAG